MKKLLLYSILFLFPIIGWAQIHLTEGDSVHIDTCLIGSYDVPMYNHVHNSGTMAASVDFFAYVVEKPTDWFYSFCTNLACYPLSGGYYAGSFSVDAGSNAEMHAICSSYGEAGSGLLKVIFVSGGTDSITSYFSDSICITPSAISPGGNLEWSLGPNPVQDELRWNFSEYSSAIRLEIFDIIGNKQISTRIQGQQGSIDLSKLRQGVYIVRATDLNTGQILNSTFRKS